MDYAASIAAFPAQGNIVAILTKLLRKRHDVRLSNIGTEDLRAEAVCHLIDEEGCRTIGSNSDLPMAFHHRVRKLDGRHKGEYRLGAQVMSAPASTDIHEVSPVPVVVRGITEKE